MQFPTHGSLGQLSTDHDTDTDTEYLFNVVYVKHDTT